MAENDDRRKDILRKVRGLIDKANATEFGPERDTFLAKADELMAVYAIESFELEFAKPVGEREKPLARDFNMGSRDWVSRELITGLFPSLVSHVRCILASFRWDRSKVIGYQADLDYLEMLWTSIQLHLAMQIEPHVNKELSYEENLATLKEAGLKWERIHGLLQEAGLLPPGPWERRIGVKFTKQYSDWCKRQNRAQLYANPATYQRNFVDGYINRLYHRLYEMQKANADATAGKGLVLADREEMLRNLLYELYPERRPHPPGCQCEDCHFLRCTNQQCTRSRCVAARNRKPVRYRAPAERKIDYAAVQKGRAAADTADLSGRGSRLGHDRKELT